MLNAKRFPASGRLVAGAQHMFKEIFEQPDAIRETLRGRVDAVQGVILEYEIGPLEVFRSMKHVVVVGCGTSRHAALVGKSFIEHFARLQVDVESGSEFRDRDPHLSPDTLFVAVAHSGEDEDTIEAMQQARNKGAFVLSICSANGNSIARLADCALHTHAGPEPGVVSSKTFTTQLATLYLLGLFLGNARGTLTHDGIRKQLRLLSRIPEQIERVLDNSPAIEVLAERFCDCPHAICLARGINLPVALEGAFKLNQISGIHAAAYPSAEIKHGPNVLVEKGTNVIVLVPRDKVYRKTLANLQHLRTRDGLALAIATEGDEEITAIVDYVLRIPEADAYSNPFLTAVSLQLFAYCLAELSGFQYAPMVRIER